MKTQEQIIRKMKRMAKADIGFYKKVNIGNEDNKVYSNLIGLNRAQAAILTWVSGIDYHKYFTHPYDKFKNKK